MFTIVLPYLNLTKLKLEYLNLALHAKKNYINTDRFFASLQFDFFRVQLKFAFRIRPFETRSRHMMMMMMIVYT